MADIKDYEKLAKDLEEKAKEIRVLGEGYTKNNVEGVSADKMSGICCGTCQFMSPCTPFEATPAKCEGGCTVTSFV